MFNIINLLILDLLIVCAACQSDMSKTTIVPNNSEAIRIKLDKNYRIGIDGIPYILDVLNEGLKNPYDLSSYASVNHSIKYLYMLAKRGIFHKDEIPFLIGAIKKQISIKDTYLTAETIRIITNIDVGYNKEFVNNYRTSDEDKRQEMIREWEKSILKFEQQ